MIAADSQLTHRNPKAGDVVLHCGHPNVPEGHQFFDISGTEFTRPDGTKAEADWLLACARCLAAAGDDPQKVRIRGDATWNGEEPYKERRILLP